MSKIVLSFHDAIIYEEDMKILKSETEWLNDRIISFYFEYLVHPRRFPDHGGKILFIGPEVTQAIKMTATPAEVKMVYFEPLRAFDQLFIVFAVNDNSLNAAGGSHWSLLVWCKLDNTFYHFDSSSGSNYSSCAKLVKILRATLDVESAKLENVQCLQQNNSYDCGIFLLCHADIAYKTIMKENSLENVKKLDPKKVHVKRSELIEIIENLANG